MQQWMTCRMLWAILTRGLVAVALGSAGVMGEASIARADLPPGANATCPVMEGEPVDEEIYADHEGLRVYFCCKKCRSAFVKDPSVYATQVAAFRETVKRVERVAAPAAPAVDDAKRGSEGGASSGTGFDGDALNALLFASSEPDAWRARRHLRMAFVSKPALDARTGHEIDDAIRAKWSEARRTGAERPPELCDDSVFVRRVYLDLIGVIPTLKESARFVADSAPDKRQQLIDELLARSQDYADHWTPFWEDALGSTNGNNTGGVPTRGNYREWINKSFRENKPFDVFAAQLVDTSLPGAKKPEIAEANGRRSRTSYILNETHTATLQSAANVAQVFMGTAMKCASCHSHFENMEWPQQRFLGFAGMFGDHDLEVIRCEKKSGTFVEAAFPFQIPGAPKDVPADESGRLKRVAQLLIDPANPRFAKAIVNRLWKRYIGMGFYEPTDDFRLDRASSHPELLDWLAYDLMSHDFDLKRTIRLILNSETYQTRYDPAVEDHFDIQKPDAQRFFRSPSLRRLTAEQIVDSIRVATTQRLDPRERLFHRTSSSALTKALGKPAARSEVSTARPDDVAVVQALELLNGEEFQNMMMSGTFVARVAKETDVAASADEMFRAVLTRSPHAEEAKRAVDFIISSRASSVSPPEANVDAVWLDDELPLGELSLSTMDWPWTDNRAASGRRSHSLASKGKQVQHYFLGVPNAPAWKVGPTDVLHVDAFIDPKDPPKEIMVQWHAPGEEGWEHRAYWGENLITFGAEGAPSRRRAGDLPETGRWVTLEIAAIEVGFGLGAVIDGLSFDQVGGTVYWDLSGVSRGAPAEHVAAAADLLWSLFSSPEFQYVR